MEPSFPSYNISLIKTHSTPLLFPNLILIPQCKSKTLTMFLAYSRNLSSRPAIFQTAFLNPFIVSLNHTAPTAPILCSVYVIRNQRQYGLKDPDVYAFSVLLMKKERWLDLTYRLLFSQPSCFIALFSFTVQGLSESESSSWFEWKALVACDSERTSILFSAMCLVQSSSY